MKTEQIATVLLLAVISYFIFFLKLNAFPIRPWDEALYSNNAYEMWKSGRYFVLLDNYHPDEYNTKPFLSIWLQVISIGLLGFNELAVRLPSAIAAASTAIVLFVAVRRFADDNWALSAILVLVTSAGFVHFHTARTGDMDALLCLFLTCSNIAFYRLICDEQTAGKNIFLFILFISLAFATKTFAAFLFLPAQLILLFVYRKFFAILKNRNFYLGLIVFSIVGILPLILRNAEQPGYLKKIFFFDAMRITNVVENHTEPFDFYLKNLVVERFSLWIAISFTGLIMMVRSNEEKIRKLGILTSTGLISYFMIISFSATKLEWYDMPLYPLLALGAGYAISRLLTYLQIEKMQPLKQIGFIVLVFSIPLFFAYKKTNENWIEPGDQKAEQLSNAMFLACNSGISLDKYVILKEQHTQCLNFYLHKFSERNEHFRIINFEDSLKCGDRVLTANDSIKKLIRNNFNTNEKEIAGSAIAMELLSVKSKERIQ